MQKNMELNLTTNFDGSQKSRAQMIFESLGKKEITQTEANRLTAHLISETLHDHPVRPYPVLATDLAFYINQREHDLAVYSEATGIKLGEWIHVMNEVFSLNRADIDLLAWAKNICMREKQLEAAKKIRWHLEAHKNNLADMGLFQKALFVQKKDSSGRRTPESHKGLTTR